MFTPHYQIAKSVSFRSRKFRLPSRADVPYKQVHKAMKLGNSLVTRLARFVGIPSKQRLANRRVIVQLMKKASKHILDMANTKVESYVEENPELKERYDNIMYELIKVVGAVRKQNV